MAPSQDNCLINPTKCSEPFVIVVHCNVTFRRSHAEPRVGKDNVHKLFNSLDSSWTVRDTVGLLAYYQQSSDKELTWVEFISWVLACRSSRITPIAQHIVDQLPAKPRICILGGKGFRDPDAEKFVVEFGKRCAERLSDQVLFITGGMQGVQAAFVTNFGSPSVIHLVHKGAKSGFDFGKDLEAGATFEERVSITSQVGHIYISIEGGPGVANEAKACFDRGAFVLPLMWSGGASGGRIKPFPEEALQKPDFCTVSEWALLKDKGERPSAELATTTAHAMVIIIEKCVAAGKCK